MAINLVLQMQQMVIKLKNTGIVLQFPLQQELNCRVKENIKLVALQNQT